MGSLSAANHTASFDASERAWIRHELGAHFGQQSEIRAGFLLKVWKSGPQRGSPRAPSAVQSMVDRGLLAIRSVGSGARVYFTDAGLAELKALLSDKPRMPPAKFGHLYRELGLGEGTADATK